MVAEILWQELVPEFPHSFWNFATTPVTSWYCERLNSVVEYLNAIMNETNNIGRQYMMLNQDKTAVPWSNSCKLASWN